MNKLNFEILTEKTFASSVAEEIVTVLNYAIEDRGYATLSLAGGRTPASIYRKLSKPPYAKQIDWKKVYFVWGDERFVPADDVNSNYRMVKETLLSSLDVDESKVLNIKTDNMSHSESANSYEKELRSILKDKLSFDLVLLGMGEDGHTASIFPNDNIIDSYSPNDFSFDSDPLVADVINPNDTTQRITLTPNLIFNAKQVFFIVTGANKALMLNEIANGDKSVKEIPAKLSFSGNSKVTWFVDALAGKNHK